MRSVCACYVTSVMSNSATLWTVARQDPLSLGFSGQECWSRLLCPPPGGSFWPRDEPVSLMPPALAGGFFTTSATGKPLWALYDICKSQVFDSSSVKDRRGITASFISSKGEQPKCPPTDDGINKMSSVCAMEYYSSLRRKLWHMLQHG